MPTDPPVESGLEERCFLASIAYLERNDYTAICQVTRRVIKAKDGKRSVYVWLSLKTPDCPPGVAIPSELARMADHDHARIDVISISIVDDKASLKHIMNAQLAPLVP